MTRPLAILSVCRGFPTPVDPSSGIFVLNRVEAMARQADVRVIQPVPYFPVVAPLPGWARVGSRPLRNVEIRHAPMFYLPRILKRLDGMWLDRAVRPLLAVAERERPLDLVDAHFGYPDGVGAVRAARRIGVSVFVTLRGLEVDVLRAPPLAESLVEALQLATGVITVSHSLRELALAAGVRAERLAVIHNAVSRAQFSHGSMADARKQLGLSPGRRLVVSVGNLLRVKRHDVLLAAFGRLRAQWPDVELAIIGGQAHEPETQAKLRLLATELGVGACVRFEGRLPPAAVATWLRAADVFALASEREGCCNAVLESLACGTPVVVTRVGDNPHFVKESFNGFLVGVEDSEALAAALGRVLSAQALAPRAEIAAALHRQVGDWDDVAGRVLAFFRERLAAAAAGAGESAR